MSVNLLYNKKSKIVKHDLSICISTKDKPHFINQLIDFLNYSDFKGELLIADAGETALEIGSFESVVGSTVSFKIKIIKAPNTTVVEALWLLKDSISTSFFITIGDDDFIFPKCAEKFCSYLRNCDSSIIGVTGLAMLLDSNTGGLQGYETGEIDNKNPENRVYDLIKQYRVILFSIIRSEYYESIFKVSKNENSAISQEILIMIRVAALGMIKKINVPFLIRGVGHERTILPQLFSEGQLDSFIEEISSIESLKHTSLLSIRAWIYGEFLKNYIKFPNAVKTGNRISFFNIVRLSNNRIVLLLNKIKWLPYSNYLNKIRSLRI